MTPADVTIISGIANSQAVWAIVALILGGFLYRKLHKDSTSREQRLLDQEAAYRLEAREREKQLMIHLERSNESQEKSAAALEGINRSLTSLEGRVDRIEKHAYKNEGGC